MKQRTLSDILVDQGVLSAEQIQRIQQEAVAQSLSWDEYAVKQGLMTALDLAHARALYYDLPYIATISEKMAVSDILSQVPLRFLRDNGVLPIRWEEHPDYITVVTDDPDRFQPLDELRLLFSEPLLVAVAARPVITEAINKYYPFEGEKEMIADLAQEGELEPEMDFSTIGEEDIVSMASEAPIIKLVNHILYQAVKRGASDIHIEPFERELQVRYRIDGILHDGMRPPKRAQSAIVSRLKIMANMNIAEKRVPQDNRIQLKVANKAIDIRVSVLPVVYGERLVMRLLDKTKTFGKLEALGMNERDYGALMHSIAQPNGIILMTGPTGSGKTSTLYAILSKLNSPEVNIITVEDPVEYQMNGIGQVQVKEKVGLTFAAALRAILRQDPDIVMIGETRDTETAQIAIQAALTGHLVLSTLHTNSAAATVTRLVDMGIEPFLIASTLISVIAQRLVRRLCDTCKQRYAPESSALALLGVSPNESKKIAFYKAVGCDDCLHTGYKGRIAIFEVMVVSGTIARMIVERADTHQLQQKARDEGMRLLIEDGRDKVKQGLTTIEEVLAEASFGESVAVS